MTLHSGYAIDVGIVVSILNLFRTRLHCELNLYHASRPTRIRRDGQGLGNRSPQPRHLSRSLLDIPKLAEEKKNNPWKVETSADSLIIHLVRDLVQHHAI